MIAFEYALLVTVATAGGDAQPTARRALRRDDHGVAADTVPRPGRSGARDRPVGRSGRCLVFLGFAATWYTC